MTTEDSPAYDLDPAPPAAPAARRTWQMIRNAFDLEQLRLWVHAIKQDKEPLIAAAAYNGLRFWSEHDLAELDASMITAWGSATAPEAKALRAVAAALNRIRQEREQKRHPEGTRAAALHGTDPDAAQLSLFASRRIDVMRNQT